MTPFNRSTPKHLGELLVEQGIIDRQQVAMALDYQKQKGGLFGRILVELKFATEENIAQALTCQYGFPYLPLANYDIDAEVIQAVPLEVCEKYCLIPIDKIGKSLTLAMANPLHVNAIEEVTELTGCAIQTFVSTGSDIQEAIKKYYKS